MEVLVTGFQGVNQPEVNLREFIFHLLFFVFLFYERHFNVV